MKCGYDVDLGQMATLQDGQHEAKWRAYETHRCVGMCVRARFSERACISLCHAVVLSLFSMPCRLSVRAYVVCVQVGECLRVTSVGTMRSWVRW